MNDRFEGRSLKSGAWIAGFILACAWIAAQAQPKASEPIAYVGHGAMFDTAGNEIAPSLQFIADAQRFYRASLIAKVSRGERSQFEKMEARLTKGLRIESQARLVINGKLLDWLVDHARLDNADRVRGKLKVLNRALSSKLPERSDGNPRSSPEPFVLPEELRKRLPVDVTLTQELLTGTSGAAYRTLCTSHGVPVPPDFGPGSPWVSRGTISGPDLFIVRSLSAEVLTWESSSPAGMCIALPRFDSANTVQADGIICLGQSDPLDPASAKVCFWDNQDLTSSTGTFTFQRGAAQPTSQFLGGSDLLAGVGGVCSDCHAGENPYIIQGPVLSSLSGVPLPTFAPTRYDPIVRTGDAVPWPENPGPMNSPSACSSCHGVVGAPGFAGRLPHISTALPGYCGSVLRAAVGAKIPPLPSSMLNPAAVMPPPAGGLACTPNMPTSDPRYIACTAGMTAPCTPALPTGDPRIGDPMYDVNCTPMLASLLAWCGSAATGDASNRGDPHITTIGGVNYDFQGAGEFVHLRAGTGLEVQLRHTPVATASAIANDYTGLTSCVSVNTALAARVGDHRVTFQPGRNPDNRSEGVLRVDGRPVTLGPRGLALGGGGRVTRTATGGGIEILFPDKTHLLATPGFWGPPNNIWYLNVDVDNSPGREGIMGAILPGSWLPLLPDGTPFGRKPASLSQRNLELNQQFADAWRVTASDSLFDYAPGESTATFTNRSWPPDKPPCVIPGSKIPPAKPMDPRKARDLCAKVAEKTMRAQCVFDVTVTGQASFANTYLLNQQLKKYRPVGTHR